MTLWKLTLSYDGTGFHGWQVQPGLPTVQGTLAAALAHITGESVLPQGSGRTDAGVHALGQVASFPLDAPLPPENLLRAVNRALPPSIRVLSAEIAPPGFHARHSACGKTYEYRLFESNNHQCICPPFLAPYVWDCRWPLALEPMQQAAALLLGTHDFTSFAAADPDLTMRRSTPATDLSSRPEPHRGEGEPPAASAPNPIKTITLATVQRENGLLIFRIAGSGFLHHMVRNLMGTLVEIGRGAMSVDDLPRILAARDRTLAGPTAPPNGLFLVRVDYPGKARP
jgi:tRNA pseudouridine38-40 synthase